MKYFVLIALLFFVAVVKAEMEDCESNGDCGDGDCCVHMRNFAKGVCKPLRQKDEFCFLKSEWNDLGDKHRYLCPCAEGLECKAAKVTEENGITKYEDVKCVDKTQ